MSCPCDTIDFPPAQYIAAGLTRLPRQVAYFPQFRAALLHDLGVHPALAAWRGRQPDDFGIMLLEMWAYVCDVVSFYDETFAHECYIGTARQRSSLRKLVGLLGYLPCPAVGAMVDLAVFAGGRQALTLPPGVAFRSGAFQGNPPQTFELTSATGIHPFYNEWTVSPVVSPTFASTDQYVTSLLCKPGTVGLKRDDVVLVVVGATLNATTVQSISPYKGQDGASYTQVEFADQITIPANTAVTDIRLQKPGVSARASQWSNLVNDFAGSPPVVTLDSIYRTIGLSQNIVIEYDGDFVPVQVVGVNDITLTVTPATSITVTPSGGSAPVSVAVPPVTTIVTQLTLPGNPDPPASDNNYAVIYFGFADAGSVVIEATTAITPSSTIAVPTPVIQPADVGPPSLFQMEDENNTAVEFGATLDFPSGVLTLNQGVTWTSPLTPPLLLFGNIVSATRGTTVTGEVLGTGDATQVNQTFILKKSPLTYLPAPTAGNASGVASTLQVYVDGVLWTEVRSFYGVAPDATVYIVRQDDNQVSTITIGDGVRGQRLPTGAQVVANYRYGAGAASPPAGSITQISKPVTGLKSVLNPVAAYGGGDAEAAGSLQEYAPSTALIMGRAVSLRDMEAVVASVPGVRAAQADWRWNDSCQCPVVQIFYIGDPGLDTLITQRLSSLTEEDTPIDVEAATAVPGWMAIQVTIDPTYQAPDVLAQIRSSLMDPETGLLSPECVGIGLPLYRSRIYEYVMNVSGALSVASLTVAGFDFNTWAISAGAGNYYDFQNGNLLLNGT